MFNQKGSMTIIAIITMIFVGILLSGIAPFISNETGFSGKTRDGLEAQCAAEIGLRRGMVLLRTLTTDDLKNQKWTAFTDKYCNYNVADAKEPGLAAMVRQYKLQMIDKTAVPGHFPYLYNFTSVGEVKGTTRSVFIDVMVGPGLKGLASYSDSFETDTVCDGLNADIYTNKPQDTDKLGTGDNDPKRAKVHGSGDRYTGVDISVPRYDYLAYKKKAIPLPELHSNGNTLNTNGMYYHDGNLTISQDNVQLIGDKTVIFVDGDITITGNTFKTCDKEIYIIAKGNINIGSASNSDSPSFTNVVLLAETGNINVTNLGKLQPGIMATPGKIDCVKGAQNINTNDEQAKNLANNFNEVMLKFYGASSSTVGTTIVTVYGDWHVK
jgi:hypothetical protein